MLASSPGKSEPHLSKTPASANAEPEREGNEIMDGLRQERDQYRDKLDRISEVLKVWRTDLPQDNDHRKIVHDVRNLVNEVVLLRELTNLDDDE